MTQHTFDILYSHSPCCSLLSPQSVSVGRQMTHLNIDTDDSPVGRFNIPYEIPRRTSQIILCLKMSLAQKFDRRRGSTIVLQSLLSNFKLIPKAKLPISRLRHFTRRYDLSRYEIGPYILPCLGLINSNIYCTTSTVFMIRFIGGYN